MYTGKYNQNDSAESLLNSWRTKAQIGAKFQQRDDSGREVVGDRCGGANDAMFGANDAMFGANDARFGDKRAIFGDNSAFFGDKRAIFGDNSAIFGERRARCSASPARCSESHATHNDSDLIVWGNPPEPTQDIARNTFFNPTMLALNRKTPQCPIEDRRSSIRPQERWLVRRNISLGDGLISHEKNYLLSRRIPIQNIRRRL